MPPVFINGRFLSQSLTGVQRYAAEIVKAMDALITSGQAPPALQQARFVLLTPPDAREALPLKTIETRRIGSRRGHLWDQVDLALAARSGSLVSLANSGPVLHRRHLVILHDAQVYRHPEFFSRSYLALHRTLGRLYARFATLGTVSAFSRDELAMALGVAPAGIRIIPNSAEHMGAVVPDESILAQLGLASKRFFLALGTMTRNKNIALAAKASALLGDPACPLVVVGGGNHQVFGAVGGAGADGDGSTIFAGRLSDEQIAALYSHATAFIFPSLYEGFGVPPLEAMTFDCPVIASTAGAVMETCGNAATYFDPADAPGLAKLMAERLAGEPALSTLLPTQRERVALYSWRRSAAALLEMIAEKR